MYFSITNRKIQVILSSFHFTDKPASENTKSHVHDGTVTNYTSLLHIMQVLTAIFVYLYILFEFFLHFMHICCIVSTVDDS